MTTFTGDANSRFPGEPFVLVGGEAVHVGAMSLLHVLEESGHRVSLDPELGIVVEPLVDVTDNQLVLLEAFDVDLAILLRAGADPVRH